MHAPGTARDEPRLVGRSRELSELDSQLAGLRHGRGGLVYLEGDPGLGKTRLLREIDARARPFGYWTLWGTASAGPVQRPYQALEEVAQAVAQEVAAPGPQSERLRATLQPYARELVAVLPSLKQALSPSSAPDLRTPGASVRACLGGLLCNLGSAERPAVVLLDDCQWAEDLAEVIADCWQDGHRCRYLLLVASFRSDAVEAFRHRAPDLHLRLEPLTRSQVAEVIRDADASMSDEVRGEISAASGGNPFLAQAILQGSWEPFAGGDVALQPPARIAQVLVRQLTQLPAETLRLLSAGAVLGRRFDTVLAGKLVGAPAPGIPGALRPAERRSLVWLEHPAARATLMHDLVREALLARLSGPDRRRLHQRAAEEIGAVDARRSFELAHHWDLAGHPDEALRHAIPAAEQAEARYAPRLAQSCWEIAERSSAASGAALRARIAESLGRALLLNGAYAQARVKLQAAHALAPSRRARSRVMAGLGELSFKEGDMPAAAEATEEALRLLDIAPPGTAPATWVRLAGQVALQALHAAVPAAFVDRSDGSRSERRLEAARLLHRLQYPYYFQGRRAAALWANLRALNLSERCPPSAELGLARSTHAVVVASFPWKRRAMRLAREGLALEQKLGNLWGEGVAHGYLAFVLCAVNRYREAASSARESVRILERAGDPWERNNAQVLLSVSLRALGELGASREAAEDAMAAARAIGDLHTLLAGQLALTSATGGRLPSELVLRHGREDHIAENHLLQARALWSMARGRPVEAASFLRVAAELARATGARDQFVAALHARHAAALRQQLERLAPHGLPPPLLREAKRTSRLGLEWARRFPASLPLALREAGRLAALEGRPRRARRRLDESLRVAQAQGVPLQIARTLAARGAIGLAHGWPGACEDLERGRRQLSLVGASPDEELAQLASEPAERLPQAEPFAAAVRTARTLLTSRSRQAVLEHLCELAADLMGVEQCLALDREPRGPDGVLRPAAGDPRMAVRDEVAREVMSLGHALAVPEPPRPEATSGEVLAPPRWLLYVPLQALGRPVGCLVLASGDVFDEARLKLAELLSVLGGATLENIEGFSRVESLAQSLEQQLQADGLRLEQASRQLERRQAVLRNAEEKLLQTDRLASLGMLVAGLAHEIRNPLGVILGYAQVLLKRSGDDPSTRRPLLAIERQAQRILKLAHLLLEQSRARSTELRWIAPRELVERTVDVERLRAGQEEVKLRIEVSEPLPEVEVVLEEVLSALVNLVDNAFDASAAGGEIVLGARVRELGGESGVELSVADAGAGIAPEDLPRVFEPFFSTKAAGRGTGLGLPFVRKTIDGHGGTVEIDSALGKGTAVRMWLPRSQSRSGGAVESAHEGAAR